MIDILVYLFENYLPEACPSPNVLMRKLSAAGFEREEIETAIDWLDGLAGDEIAPCQAPCSGGMRIYDNEEISRLSVQARGFLSFLETANAIDIPLRETIINRALFLPDAEITLDRLKVIVLAVIWRYRHEVDALILEELLNSEISEEDDDFDQHDSRIVRLH